MLPQLSPGSFPELYDFEGLRFYPDIGRLIRLKDGRQYSIRPKESAFLLALLSKPNQAVTYDELRQLAWPELNEVKTLLPTLRETKRTVDRLLADITKSDHEIIETVLRVGYRLSSTVTHPREEETDERPNPVPLRDSVEAEALRRDHLAEKGLTEAAHADRDAGKQMPGLVMESASPMSLQKDALTNLDRLVATWKWHLLIASFIYALLYAVALPLEIAYEWDRFGKQALGMIPFVLLWVFGTSAAALAVDWVWTLRGKRVAIAISFSIFLSAALLLYVALAQFLPAYPITQSRLQSLTAQGAYLKNAGLYFLPLAVVFLILPFHQIASLVHKIRRRDSELTSNRLGLTQTSLEDLIIIKPKTLGVLLFTAGLTSLALTFHLLDNLKVGPYMNQFTLLAMLRLVLYFGLGIECLLWFAYSLNEIKRSAQPDGPALS